MQLVLAFSGISGCVWEFEVGAGATETGSSGSEMSLGSEVESDGDGDPVGDGDGDPVGDGDGDPAGDGDGDPAGDGYGDGESQGDGDGDEECTEAGCACVPSLDNVQGDCSSGYSCHPDTMECVEQGCGNDIVEPGEDCDGTEVESSPVCLATCKYPRSCKEINEFDNSLPTGDYVVYLGDVPWLTHCDMDVDGGGWTRIQLGDLTCPDDMQNENRIVIAEYKAIAGGNGTTLSWDNQCRPRTRDDLGWNHSYSLDIGFPAGYHAFFLRGHKIKAHAGAGQNSEIVPGDDGFAQTQWTLAYSMVSASGDVSFGSDAPTGLRTSYSAKGVDVDCMNCEASYPVDDEVVSVVGEEELAKEVFRIGWGEWGLDSEGWYPWWEGSIYLR